MKSTQIILGFLQLNCFHVFAIQVHDNINEATTGRSNLVTATLETTSVAPNPALNAIQNTTETDDDGKTDPNSIKSEWPSKKPKPDLIVIKKKKLITKPMNSSFSSDKVNLLHSNVGTLNDESKETKNFVPSPELTLSEDSSHASVTHDSYPVSDLNENNHANFVPSTNPLLITQSYQPTVVGVHQKYHSHVGKLPVWPYPYENIDNKFKWKILSKDHKHKGDGKLLFPTEETIIAGKSPTYTDYQSQIADFHAQPFAYDGPEPPHITSLPTPFSYTTISASDIQGTDIEPTPDNRLPPWMEMLHIKNDAYDIVKTPIEYYAKAIDNHPNQPHISHGPHYGLTHIDKNILWHSVFKFLATAVPIGLVISALSPNVVTVQADSPPRLNGTFSRINNTTGYRNPLTATSILRPIDENC